MISICVYSRPFAVCPVLSHTIQTFNRTANTPGHSLCRKRHSPCGREYTQIKSTPWTKKRYFQGGVCQAPTSSLPNKRFRPWFASLSRT